MKERQSKGSSSAVSTNQQQYSLDRCAPGCTIKIPHEGCSTSAALSVSNRLDGYLIYCHKCKFTLFVPHQDSVSERRVRKELIEAQQEALSKLTYDLPEDFSQTIAPIGLAWLGKAGWTVSLINRYNIGWSERLKRVILPMPIGYTARAVLPFDQPKYLQKCPEGALWRSNQMVTSTCVVTEDILSAGRVGELLSSYALNGTSASAAEIGALCRHDLIIVWLDPDRAGSSGAKALCSNLSFIGKRVVKIYNKEPKHMTREELRSVLEVYNDR